MCPGIALVEARHEAYVDYHHRIIEAVERCVPVSAVMSIDEMACALIGKEQPLLAALDLAQRVKASVREHAGSTLRCSVGLATNRYLAKIASDMEKPDGLVALTPRHPACRARRIDPCATCPAWARAWRSGWRLRRHRDHGAAAGARPRAHARGVGRRGRRKAVATGCAARTSTIPRSNTRSSISQSHVLPPELRTEQGAYSVLHKLLHKAAMRLRSGAPLDDASLAEREVRGAETGGLPRAPVPAFCRAPGRRAPRSSSARTTRHLSRRSAGCGPHGRARRAPRQAFLRRRPPGLSGARPPAHAFALLGVRGGVAPLTA